MFLICWACFPAVPPNKPNHFYTCRLPLVAALVPFSALLLCIWQALQCQTPTLPEGTPVSQAAPCVLLCRAVKELSVAARAVVVTPCFLHLLCCKAAHLYGTKL
jgi:hypothetical protein